MILRRVIEHVKAQNWFAVAIDFIIVVLGVFIGLQVQEWSGEREDRRHEAQIVADLLADLEIDRAEFANGLAADARRASTANAALTGAGLQPIRFDWKKRGLDRIDYSFDFPAGDADDARPDRLWSEIVLGYHPGPSTSTIDALIGAGEMRIIRDRDIVREIQDYRTLTESVIQQNDKVLAIREDVLKIGASYGLAPYQDMPEAEFLRLVASERELAAAIRIMATFVIYHRGELKAADARAAEMQRRLKDYQATFR